MGEYLINLPKTVKTNDDVSISLKSSQKNDNLDVLSLFNTDNDKQILSSEEIKNAVKYFIDVEKQLSVNGKKGDGVITSKDLLKIIQTDDRFKEIRKKYNDDHKLATIMSKAILVLTNALDMDKSVNKYNSTLQVNISDNQEAGIVSSLSHLLIPENYTYVNEPINVDGKKVIVAHSGDGKYFALDKNGKKYTNPDFVAKCLGYETEKTWFGLGENKYYTTGAKEGYLHVGSGGHTYSDKYKYYKEWNPKDATFINGEAKKYGARTHYIGTR